MKALTIGCICTAAGLLVACDSGVNTQYTFFEKRCGPGSGCPLNYDLACRFTHDDHIECTDGQGTDLSGFLDQKPKRASIQIVAQGDGYGSNTNTVVEFQ